MRSTRRCASESVVLYSYCIILCLSDLLMGTANFCGTLLISFIFIILINKIYCNIFFLVLLYNSPFQCNNWMNKIKTSKIFGLVKRSIYLTWTREFSHLEITNTGSIYIPCSQQIWSINNNSHHCTYNGSFLILQTHLTPLSSYRTSKIND